MKGLFRQFTFIGTLASSTRAARSYSDHVLSLHLEEAGLSAAEPQESAGKSHELVFGVSANAASEVEREVQSDTLICGGNEIYEDMKVRKTAETIALVKWGEHLETAESFIRAQTREVLRLEADLDERTVKVRKIAAAHDVTAVSLEDIEKLIILAVTDPTKNASDPVSAAEKSRCRTPHFTNNNEAMEASLPVIASSANVAFWNVARKLLEDGVDDSTEIFKKFDKDDIDLKCDAMLVGAEAKSTRRDADLQWTYCDDVCIMFERIGIALNDKNSYLWGKGIDPRLEKLEQLQRNIDYVQANIQECKAAKETIVTMRNSVGVQAEKMQQKQDLFFDAEADVQEAEIEMEGLEKKQTVLKSHFDEADKMLRRAMSAHAEVAKEHQSVVDEWGKVTRALKTTKERIRKVAVDFDTLQKAEEVMDKVKMSVITLISSMNVFFQNRVRQPLLDLQIVPVKAMCTQTISGNVEEWFEDAAEVDEFFELKDGLDGLEKICGEAKQVFEQNNVVDLEPICAVGEATSLVDQVKTGMQKDQGVAKDNLRKLQEILDPFHGVSSECLGPETLGEFEPFGIKFLHSPYGSAEIFSKYLKKWLNGGDFQQLYKKVQHSHTSLDASLRDLKGKEKELIRELTRVMDRVDMWEKKVGEALAEAEKKGQMVGGLKNLLNKLDEEIDETKRKIESYQSSQAEREKSFNRAKEKLEAHYRKNRKGLKYQVRSYQ
eukprot:TRINITY_DN1522_c1_g1_i2.p1 TRINITY_DN1522_c1_g1~~TRINITY_DN1522_c1_g1_i2.p1  ORF type:complete len:719 (-),score=159.14 TRINITY_DN1522_c1_g1_i2:172-2328(-)